MAGNFQIEEIVDQDDWGVIYRAVDNASGQSVALRRFFPFGAKGDGLNHDEQAAYSIAIRRLSQLRHASLRGVITGSCDPVDGMPYIVTQWVDGTPLLSLIENHPLNGDDAVKLIKQALEVSLLLSKVLADDVVWVETEPSSIWVVDGDSGRHFSFSLSPIKWLGNQTESRGLEAIIALAEEVMHWQGRMVAAHAGQGLGGWVKWLRDTTPSPTLHEAHNKLVSLSEQESKPIALVQAPVQVASPKAPAAIVRAKSSRAPLWALASMTLIIVVLVVWRMNFSSTPTEIAAATPGASPAEVAAPVALEAAVEMDAPVEENSPAIKPATALKPTSKDSESKNSRVVQKPREKKPPPSEPIKKQPTQLATADSGPLLLDRDALMENDGKQAVIEGVLANVRFSGTGNGPTFYLEFSNPAPIDEPRAYIMRANMKPDMHPDALKDLIGKRVRMTGQVHVEKVNIRGESGVRPRVRLNGRESIVLVK